MKTFASVPRIMAGLLAIAGIFWAARFLASPATILVALPGYLIWALWIWRATSPGTKPIFVVGWLSSMVWHLAIALVSPLISVLTKDALIILIYSASALVLSLVGLIAEVRQSSRAARSESNPSEQAAPLNGP